MLIGANNGGIDHLNAIVTFAGLVQRLQHHVPDSRQPPTPELPVDRVPLAELAVQSTSGRACPGDPEDPVQTPAGDREAARFALSQRTSRRPLTSQRANSRRSARARLRILSVEAIELTAKGQRTAS